MPAAKPGTWYGRRPDDEVAAMKAAVRKGTPFAMFWASTASKWPSSQVDGVLESPTRRTGPETQELRQIVFNRAYALYSYYAYRQRGNAAYVNPDTMVAQPYSYTVEQRTLAFRCASQGIKFHQFWTMYGTSWLVPMYRLHNWYRGILKRWRDVLTTTPTMSDEERGVAVLALASTQPGDSCAALPFEAK